MASKNLAPKVALTIAGSDSGGGAGIQADLKTFQHFGVFGTSVITAVTAQNTRAVTAIHPVPADIVEKQMAAIAEDLPPQATKSGMLATAELVMVVARGIEQHKFENYVFDPVMVATSGDRLLTRDAAGSLGSLLPLARLVTPNIDEAMILTGEPVSNPEEMERAGEALRARGARAALVTGGHLAGQVVVDVLVSAAGSRRFEHPRIATTSTHGTGCILSAAITAGLARHKDLERAVVDAIEFVRESLLTAPALGSGRGPVRPI